MLVLELGGGLVRGVVRVGGRGGGFAYKPEELELDVFLRSSRTLESFGICVCGQSVDCELGRYRRT